MFSIVFQFEFVKKLCSFQYVQTFCAFISGHIDHQIVAFQLCHSLGDWGIVFCA